MDYGIYKAEASNIKITLNYNHMKTIIFIFISTLLFFNSTRAQNRITTWDTGKITAIQAEFRSNSDTSYVQVITAQESMDSVFNFLRQTEFREYTEASEKIDLSSPWVIRLSFTGQRDQVIFWPDFATIGKTLFITDKKVVKDLKKIITHCKKC